MLANRLEPCRVFVCDDSFGYALLVKTWIEESSDVELAGVAVTTEEMLQALPGARPHVVLLDLMLPGGLITPELVAEIRAITPGVRVILASAMPEEILRSEAVRTGADTACTKFASRDELLAVITA